MAWWLVAATRIVAYAAVFWKLHRLWLRCGMVAEHNGHLSKGRVARVPCQGAASCFSSRTWVETHRRLPWL